MEYRQNNNDKIMWNMNLFTYKKKKDSPHCMQLSLCIVPAVWNLCSNIDKIMRFQLYSLNGSNNLIKGKHDARGVWQVLRGY